MKILRHNVGKSQPRSFTVFAALFLQLSRFADARAAIIIFIGQQQ